MNDLKYFVTSLACKGTPKNLAHNPVALFDTAVATLNLGDEIIMDAVAGEIRKLFPERFLYRLPTHERIGLRSYRILHQSNICFVGGSNILTTQIPFDFQWKLRPFDLPFVTNLVLMGVGWRSYSLNPNWFDKFIHKRLLNRHLLHSVRDQLTVDRMQQLGVHNVLNTGCVTMWGLTKEFVSSIPKKPAREVVVTLNAFHKSEVDTLFAGIIKKTYQKFYIWPQSIEDIPYALELFGSDATIVSPSLAAFDELLENNVDLDYVGFRLHGGIRALQRGRRTLIVSVDNRATEIARDTNLPVIANHEIAGDLEDRLRAEWPTEIKIRLSAIAAWRNQFLPEYGAVESVS